MFDGRYELLEVLGAGGLGTVFKAIQVDLGRQIALKILHPNVAKDEELCTRFMREAQALHKLSHRSIVSV